MSHGGPDHNSNYGCCLQGLLVPLVENRAGEWYPAKYTAGSNLRGVYGYKVFVAIALFLGDGLYNLVKIIILSGRNVVAQRRAKKSGLPVTAKTASEYTLRVNHTG